MEDKTNIFDLVFKDKRFQDWHITLYTTELKTRSEIENLIYYYAEANSNVLDNYSPCDIMDDLCLDKGWYWGDTEDKTIIITDWF